MNVKYSRASAISKKNKFIATTQCRSSMERKRPDFFKEQRKDITYDSYLKEKKIDSTSFDQSIFISRSSTTKQPIYTKHCVV